MKYFIIITACLLQLCLNFDHSCAQPSPISRATSSPTVHEVTSQASMLKLAAKVGDMAIRTDMTPLSCFILKNTPTSVLANWVQITGFDAAGAAATGDTIYYDLATSSWIRKAIGTSGQEYRTNLTGTGPEWKSKPYKLASDYASLTAANNALSVGEVLWLDTDINLTANLTMKAIEVRAGPGKIVQTGAYTLNMSPTILYAGDYQVFSGFASGDVTGLKEANPLWWGAVQDSGTTDSTTAFQCARAASAVVRVPDTGDGSYYKITANVVDVDTVGPLTIEGIGKPEIRLVRTPTATRADNSFILADATFTGNLTVRNLKIRGNQDGTVGTTGIGIQAAQIGGKVVIDNVECSHFNEYGVYLWDVVADIGVVDANNNRFQGVAITNNSKAIRIGHLEAYSNGGAGLDIEYSSGRGIGIKNIRVDYVRSYSNAFYGVSLSLGNHTWSDLTTAEGLTINDYGNVVFGTAITHGNGVDGFAVDFPQITIHNLYTHDNLEKGLHIRNSYSHARKEHIFGQIESFGNTATGVYIDGDPAGTYRIPYIYFHYVSSHDNGGQGIYYAVGGREPDRLVIRDSYLNNNTVANSNIMGYNQAFPKVEIHGAGWADGATTPRVLARQLVLSTDGSTNSNIYCPPGARIKSVVINVANADSGTSPTFLIRKYASAVYTDLATINIKNAGIRILAPTANTVVTGDTDSAVMGWWTAATGDYVRADPGGSWTGGGNAVCTMEIEYAW